MRTVIRSANCRACGTHVLTTAPPVADEVIVCVRCSNLPQLDVTRPVTVCQVARRAA